MNKQGWKKKRNSCYLMTSTGFTISVWFSLLRKKKAKHVWKKGDQAGKPPRPFGSNSSNHHLIALGLILSHIPKPINPGQSAETNPTSSVETCFLSSHQSQRRKMHVYTFNFLNRYLHFFRFLSNPK